MKKLLLLAGLALFLSSGAALAQAASGQFLVVPSCGGTQLYGTSQKGQPGPAAVDYFGNVCNVNTPSGPVAGTPSQPTDVTVGAGATAILTTAATRKFLSVTNTTASGFCRIGYAGLTPTATRGDPLANATAAGGQGGGRTFETTYVPQGTVTAFCSVASTIAVMEVN